jgi:hypothetical protein
MRTIASRSEETDRTSQPRTPTRKPLARGQPSDAVAAVRSMVTVVFPHPLVAHWRHDLARQQASRTSEPGRPFQCRRDSLSSCVQVPARTPRLEARYQFHAPYSRTRSREALRQRGERSGRIARTHHIIPPRLGRRSANPRRARRRRAMFSTHSATACHIRWRVTSESGKDLRILICRHDGASRPARLLCERGWRSAIDPSCRRDVVATPMVR